MSAVDADMAWQDHAACLGCDPDVFFPEAGEDSAAAKAVCAGCRVREECLEWAIATGQEYGVWGGMLQTPRRKLIKARAQAPGLHRLTCVGCDQHSPPAGTVMEAVEFARLADWAVTRDRSTRRNVARCAGCRLRNRRTA